MVYGVPVKYLKNDPVDMEFFSEKLTWLNILYNKMHCHKKNYFKLRKVKSEKSLLQKSYDCMTIRGVSYCLLV